MSPTPPNQLEQDRTPQTQSAWIGRDRPRGGNSQSGNRGSNPRSGTSRSPANAVRTGTTFALALDDWLAYKRDRKVKLSTQIDYEHMTARYKRVFAEKFGERTTDSRETR